MKSFLLFQSSIGMRLARVEEVIEVIPMVALQREMTDNEQFRGLLNYRGKIVPVFDLQVAADQAIPDIHALLIVTQHHESSVALLAREVNRIVDVEEEDIRRITPANLPAFEVAKLGDEMVRIISPQEFVA